MAKFTRKELEEAYHIYEAAVTKASETGDWATWADELFTDDVVYFEHAYGEFHGKDEVRKWIVEVMAPYPKMRFPTDWVIFDEENGAIVMCVQNVWIDPNDPDSDEFGFPNWTRLVYAGNGKFSMEEDIYNPFRDAPRVMKAWMEGGGRMETPLKVRMKHIQHRRGGKD